MTATVFYVGIVGGGTAGSSIGGGLACGGPGVVVIEQETRFRDPLRGEGVGPRGVSEARRVGPADLLTAAEPVEMWAIKRYAKVQAIETIWERPAVNEVPGVEFRHPRFQEAAVS